MGRVPSTEESLQRVEATESGWDEYETKEKDTQMLGIDCCDSARVLTCFLVSPPSFNKAFS